MCTTWGQCQAGVQYLMPCSEADAWTRSGLSCCMLIGLFLYSSKALADASTWLSTAVQQYTAVYH